MQRAPNAKLERVVDATTEPITLAQAKQFCRVEIDDDDDLISDLITAARLECETLNNRSFITTSWSLTMDYFPPYSGHLTNILPAIAFGVASVGGRNLWVNMEAGAIRLPMPPAITVGSITYVDTGGTTQTLDLEPSAGKVVFSPGTPGQISPAFGQIFPLTMPILSAVNVAYTAGYGPDATYVPKTIAMAIRTLVAHYYEHRTSSVETPDQVFRLLDATYWGSY